MNVIRVCLLVLALGAAARGEAPFERMKQQTVLIKVVIQTNAGVSVSVGSGFVIGDGRYVVTNFHVCCQPVRGEIRRTIVIHESASLTITASVKWRSKLKDLSILEPEERLDRPAVSFAPRSLCRDGQDVYAVGFPGAANLGDEESNLIPKITDGIISAMVRAPDADAILGGGTRLYQTTNGINPGNSGGPIFDECGRVVAVVSAKSRIGDAIAWAIQVDELLEELPALDISASVASSSCGAGGLGLPMQLLVAAALAAAVLVAFLRYPGPIAQSAGTLLAGLFPSRNKPPSSSREKPILRGIEGYYAGTELEMDSLTWWLGRDSRVSDLVIPDAEGVSKRHCGIRFDEKTGNFILEDAWSTNGTFLADGERIPAGEARTLRPGDRFFLATPGQLFELRMDKEYGKP